MQLCGIIIDEFNKTPKRMRPVEIWIDKIGLGSGVYDRLREQGFPVKGGNVSERPASRDKYVKLRDELWGRAKDWFEDRDCSIPNDNENKFVEEFTLELCGPRYDFDSSGKMKVEGKKELKKRLNCSPDLADAFCLTFASQRRSNSGDFFTREINIKNPLL